MSARWPSLLGAVSLVALAACSGAESHPRAPRAAPVFTTLASTTTSTSIVTATSTPSTAVPAAPLPRGTRLVITPTGVVAPLVRANPDGSVVVRTPCEGEAVAHRVAPVGRLDVLVDPGHGGTEPGAVGPNGLTERALNLAVAQQVVKALGAAGLRAMLTRTGDYTMTLTARAAVDDAARPRAFVSVHHNAAPDGPRDGPGTEVYFQHASVDSRRLSGLIYEEVFRTLSAYPGIAWVGDTDAGVKPRLNDHGGDYYAMLRQTAPTVAALAELAFISNPPEADLVARPDVQRAEGDAVARGILRYFTTTDPGSGFVEPYPRTEPAGGGGKAGCVDPALE